MLFRSNGSYRCLKSCFYTKEARKSTIKKRFGVDFYSKTQDYKRKCAETSMVNYGVTNPSKADSIKEKKKQTTLKNFGTEFPTQNSSIKEKIKLSNIEKYGFDSYSKTDIFKKKVAETSMERYGVKTALLSPLIREKITKTNLEKFNTPFPFQSNIIKEKIKNNNFKKYGRYNHNQKHYSDLAKEILEDKNKFSIALIENGAEGLAKKLGVSWSTIQRTHQKFELDIMSLTFSSYEKSFQNWLDSFKINNITNTRTVIPPQELDSYLPDYNLAIEFDGLYWHSEDKGKDKLYHYNKTKLCEEKGIRLIHIFEDEWIHKNEVCLDLVSRIIKLPNKKLFARKCELREIKNKECKEFLEKNHLQGYAVASVNIGLFFENQLVQLMSFKHARYDKKIEWENIRCCNLIGTTIIGGVHKIWKYFVKSYSPKSVVSYCDSRWFTGETYKKLNFSLKRINPPQYWYITGRDKRVHRSCFMKKRCLKLLPKDMGLEKLTEKELTQEFIGLNKIWDCGQQVWIWNI